MNKVYPDIIYWSHPLPGDNIADVLFDCLYLARLTGKRVSMEFNTVSFVVTENDRMSALLREYEKHWDGEGGSE